MRRPSTGSSPLARGLPGLMTGAGLALGIIPARAGFTYSPFLRGKANPDHPRSRGVYPPPPSRPARSPGSSPLARGLLWRASTRWPELWIIPARAGFTLPQTRLAGNAEDHPRSRGVYTGWGAQGGYDPGSSPLARGLRDHERRRARPRRIIPARAGFTGRPHARRPGRWDHPRSRGVYCPTGSGRGSRAGSSPLARGLRRQPRAGARSPRIIPARAGFTGCATICARRRRDHPRSRGVYGVACARVRASGGSSPLARGLLRQGLGEEVALGIIPARAGFTMRSAACGPRTRDHPRSRGVYLTARFQALKAAGSSPLARGLRGGTVRCG